MKSIRTLRQIGGVLLVAASLHAQAQASAPAAAPGSAQAAPGAPAASGVPGNAPTKAKARVHRRRTARDANRALARRVRWALARVNSLDVSRIVVRAHSGVVTLEGTVPEQSQVERAARAAQNVSGVRQVKNLLTLRSPGA
ncbi:BON domain-containing protein [Burkholderia sp. WAC0059]|uniref:BON domain-containing protein n=1 Tax=Burkholderia sp. WAC0059 TaxID=2066022 RepID=UPI000C7EC326|nr:BON domain-containing protein [Burkholderia sp. WAC0059]PLZ04329.1 BON domain-containing protein [Burkholderia sp. WAC0059]